MLACVLPCLLALCVFSCGTGSTGGQLVRLRTRVHVQPEIGDLFETDTGWSVRLSRAAVSLGALYYFDGEPAFALRARRLPWKKLASLFRPSVARAHPGHYVSGTALGQMTVPVALELTSEPMALPEAAGVTGLYASARVLLAQPSAANSASLNEDVAVVEGIATRDGASVHFRLSAAHSDVARSVPKAEVDGCVFEEAQVERDGTVTLTIDPRVWLNLVDFSELEAGSLEVPTSAASRSTAQVAFALGLAQRSAYRFAYEADP